MLTQMTAETSPMVRRAAALAAGVSLLLTGGAYAAVASALPSTPLNSTSVSAEAARASMTQLSPTTAPVTGSQAVVTTEVSDTTQAHGRTEKPTSNLLEGETQVETPGVDGVLRSTYAVTTRDGVETDRELVSTVVVTEARDEVVLVGTKKETATTAAPESTATEQDDAAQEQPATSSAGADVWAALAQCESGGNPRAVGAGVYGLYQFNPGTWRSVGGSGLPSDASPEEQTMRAQILQQRAGWGQWPACSRKLGLR